MKRLKVLVRERWFQLSFLLAFLGVSIVVEVVYLVHSFKVSSSTEVFTSSSLSTLDSGITSSEVGVTKEQTSPNWNTDLFTLVRESDSVVYLERKGEKLFYTSPETELSYSYSYTLYRPKEDQYQDVYYLVSTTEDSDKDKVVETVINSPRKYVGDVLKTKGTENEIFLGHNGKDVTTTVYTVNPLTGAITESSTTKHEGIATETIIRVGAKPIVELEKKDGIVYRNTTTFAVDLNTGEITETKLREALSSFGNEPAPTVEVPEFNRGVNGDMDGNAAINEVPEFTGGVGTAGEDLPPVLDVPEFTGGVNGDADGQPAINEVPEFDLSTLKPESEYGIGDSFNDGRYPKPVAEDNKPSLDEAPAVSDVEVVPADKKVVEPTVSTDSPSASPLANNVVESPNAVGTSASVAQASAPSGSGVATVAELPNTGGDDNALLGMAGLAIGALGLASLKKKED